MFSPRNSILFTVLALALAVPGQALGQATSTVTSFVVPVVDLPVSNLCTGEVVYMTGSYHHVLITVVKPNGILLISHVNPQNLQGATVEGDRYVAGGSATIVANVSPGAQTLSYPTQLVLAGPGPGTYILRQRLHITINANGVTTVSIDEVTIICRGCPSCP